MPSIGSTRIPGKERASMPTGLDEFSSGFSPVVAVTLPDVFLVVVDLGSGWIMPVLGPRPQFITDGERFFGRGLGTDLKLMIPKNRREADETRGRASRSSHAACKWPACHAQWLPSVRPHETNSSSRLVDVSGLGRLPRTPASQFGPICVTRRLREGEDN